MNGYSERSERLLNSEGEFLNLGAFVPRTDSLGPGNRAAIWVQGCPFSCPGCIAPEWIPIRTSHLVPIERIANEILKNPDISGLTISGGEPMLQARPLARLISVLREKRNIDVISFTGFHIDEIQRSPDPTIQNFLNLIDVLIDGPYIKNLNNNKGLRGSTNQRVIHLTSKLNDYDLANWPRQIEVNITNQSMMMIGIPTDKGLEAFNKTYEKLLSFSGGTDERS